MEEQALEDGIVFLTQGKREMTLSEAIGRIEIVTKDPQLTRKILEEAEKRGAIERDGVSVKSSGSVSGDYRYDDPFLESISFSFEKFKITYNTQLPDGSLGPAIEANWDIRANE